MKAHLINWLAGVLVIVVGLSTLVITAGLSMAISILFRIFFKWVGSNLLAVCLSVLAFGAIVWIPLLIGKRVRQSYQEQQNGR